jgi:hypothetical protein
MFFPVLPECPDCIGSKCARIEVLLNELLVWTIRIKTRLLQAGTSSEIRAIVTDPA